MLPLARLSCVIWLGFLASSNRQLNGDKPAGFIEKFLLKHHSWVWSSSKFFMRTTNKTLCSERIISPSPTSLQAFSIHPVYLQFPPPFVQVLAYVKHKQVYQLRIIWRKKCRRGILNRHKHMCISTKGLITRVVQKSRLWLGSWFTPVSVIILDPCDSLSLKTTNYKKWKIWALLSLIHPISY